MPQAISGNCTTFLWFLFTSPFEWLWWYSFNDIIRLANDFKKRSFTMFLLFFTCCGLSSSSLLFWPQCDSSKYLIKEEQKNYGKPSTLKNDGEIVTTHFRLFLKSCPSWVLTPYTTTLTVMMILVIVFVKCYTCCRWLYVTKEEVQCRRK